MWIYIVHNRVHLYCARHTNTGWRRMSPVTVGLWTQCIRVSELDWKQVPDSGPATENADGRVCYVDGGVRSSGNDVQTVVADDWQCLRLERSILPDTAVLCCWYVGELLHQACTGPSLPHRASASRHVETVTVPGRTCACRWQDEWRR